MLHIDEKLLKGCDSISSIYCKSFNGINNLLDKAYPDQSPIRDFDLSALCLYLCKCVEYEINCSVVQLLRKCLGIDMPAFFCRPDPSFPRRESIVDTDYKDVYLNDYRDAKHRDKLKTIPLGDAYYAMVSLVADRPSFFQDFRVLSNYRFREIWRSIGRIRNEIAHAGLIINKDMLMECYNYCLAFFRDFMPLLQKIKDELSIEGWNESVQSEEYVPCIVHTDIMGYPVLATAATGKPKATIENYKVWQSLDKEMNRILEDVKDEEKELDALDKATEQLRLRDDYSKQFDWYDVPFESGGKYGLKDITGKIVVPARYDGFFEYANFLFCTAKVCIAIKDGKFGFVERYSGVEKSGFVYDKLNHISYVMGCISQEVLLFWRDGSQAFGLISVDGNECIPCLIDEVIFLNPQGLYFRSGEKYGYFDFLSWKYLEPIYDRLEFDYDSPVVFVKNNVEGYVTKDGKFLAKEEYTKIAELELESEDFVEYYDLIGNWEYDPD